MSSTLRFLFVILAVFSLIHSQAQRLDRPKAVVGVVVDQMRFDYLYRYYDFYGEGGFKRLMAEGMNFTYAQYNYLPTYTGPGHASIYTGSTPYHHGIISNSWYDRDGKRMVYCVNDLSFETVGAKDAGGQMAPTRLESSTITDELRMSNNGLSRVFAASIKDRASVLPGGHMANAAYWYDNNTGDFITSSYYMEKLPAWVKKFNKEDHPERLMANPWELMIAQDHYRIAMPDEGHGETDAFREGNTTFPHNFDALSEEEKIDYIRTTPYGNNLLTAFSLELLKSEEIGMGEFTDFLAISYSSPDYIGHAYGPNSMEIMDNYLRLDKDIEQLLNGLDEQLGKGNYLLFLTADHGVKANGMYLEANRMPNGIVDSRQVLDTLRAFCQGKYGTPTLIETVSDNHVYYDHTILDILNLDIRTLNDDLTRFLRNTYPQMGAIHSKMDLNGQTATRSMHTFMLNGFHLYRSGDLAFELTPGYITSLYKTGTTHGASFDYDTHIPLIFHGWKVPAGESHEEVYIEDIAATIAYLLRIPEPDACIGVPLIKRVPGSEE